MLARLLYDRLAPSFMHRAFMQINAQAGDGQVQHILGGALEQLGASKDKGGAAAQLDQLKALVKSTAVLLVIDNVWTASQLDGLLPTEFHEGSRIIISSRQPGLPHSTSYEVGGLWAQRLP